MRKTKQFKNHCDGADFISDERTYFWMKYDI